MLNLLKIFFLSSGQFIPHGHCYLWKPELVPLHIISDSLIALSYYSIPIALTYFVGKRSDFPFNWIVLLFGAFIIACGTTHLLQIWTLWHPSYWLSGLLKAITAVMSLYAAMALVRLLPEALALPSSKQLRQANLELEREITERKQVEAALRCSQEQYRAIIEDQTELIARSQPDGTLTFVNEAYCRYFGESRSQLVGKRYEPSIFPEDREKVARLLNSLNLETPVGTVENRVVVAGEVRWMQWINRAIFDESGQFVEFQSVGRDITYAKQIEEELRQSEERWQLVLQGNNDGIWDLNLKTNQVCRSVRWREILGYEEGEIEDNNEEWLTRIHPDDFDRLMQLRQDYLARKIPHYAIEYRLRCKDGSYKWVLVRSQAVWDEAGNPVRMVGSMTDISDRKQVEERLRLLERAVAASNNGIIVSDARLPDRPVVYVNSGFERITGYTPEEIAGENCRLLQGNDTEQPAVEKLRRAIATGTETQVVLRNYRKDGTLFWNEFCLTPVRDETGNLTHFIGVQTDITERKLAEEALLSSEERFRALVNSAPVGIFQTDLMGDCLFVNPRWIEIAELSRDEAIGQGWENVLHPEDRLLAVSEWYDAAATGREFTMECRFLTPQGKVKWVFSTVVPIREGSGAIIGYLGTVTDISDKKHAEEALRESEERYRAVVEQSAEGIYFVDALTKQVIEANSTYLNLLGYTLTEILSLTIYDMVNGDRERLDTCIEYILHKKHLYPIETQHRRKDGSLVDVELSVSLICYRGRQVFCAVVQDITERKQAEETLRQQLLREQLLGAIAQRIRQSLNLKDILERTVQEVQQVLVCDCVSIYRVWQEGRGSAITGAVVPELGDLQEQTFPEIVVPQESWQSYREGQIDAICNVERDEVPACWVEFVRQFEVKAELVVPIVLGERLWGLLLVNQCGEPRQWQPFEIDVLRCLADQVAIAIQQSQLYEQSQSHAQRLEQTLNELQKTQAQLIQKEKMASLGQLVAGVAHEINNPTSFIYGNINPAMEYVRDLLELLELYRQHYPNPGTKIAERLEAIEPDFIAEDFPKLLESMQEGAHRISQIVLSLRNFSRLDEEECKWADIHEGIESTLLILQHRLKQQPHRPEIQVIREYGQLPKVECYPGQLNQVLMNILSNAIDALEEFESWQVSKLPGSNQLSNFPTFKPSNPTIGIRTEVEERGWVRVCISDNGYGIEPDVLPKIFDPFFTTKPVGKGTGLGLSIAYQIVVDKHGGKLGCDSAVSEGTEFAIELPIAQKKYEKRRDRHQLTSLFF